MMEKRKGENERKGAMMKGQEEGQEIKRRKGRKKTK